MKIDNMIGSLSAARSVSKSVDLKADYFSMSITDIYADIARLSPTLRWDEKVHMPGYNTPVVVKSGSPSLVKKLDKVFQRVPLYTRLVRLPLYKVYRVIRPDYLMKIDGKQFFSYQDGELVDALYECILGRKPDEQEKHTLCFELLSCNISKIQLVRQVSGSAEARMRKIRVTGISSRVFFSKVRNFTNRIPVVGYFMRLGANLVFLSRRMKALQTNLATAHTVIMTTQANLMTTQADLVGTQTELVTSQTNLVATQAEFTTTKTELEATQAHLAAMQAHLRDIEKRNSKQEEQSLKEEMHKNELQRKEKELYDKIYLAYATKEMHNPREDVKNRLQPYIEKINERYVQDKRGELTVVDLGCGGGEWLELLHENGYDPLGVDGNPYVIEYTQDANPELRLQCEDAFKYLAQSDSNSHDVITSFHMIEHFDTRQLFTFFNECRRVLRQGGLVLLVTPNAQNIITATYLFDFDFTHQKPIPQELLRFFLREWDFAVLETVTAAPLNFVPMHEYSDDPISHIAFRFNLEQEYGVLAVKE